MYYSKPDRAKYVSEPYSQVSPYCVIRVEHQGKKEGRGASGARALGGAVCGEVGKNWVFKKISLDIFHVRSSSNEKKRTN